MKTNTHAQSLPQVAGAPGARPAQRLRAAASALWLAVVLALAVPLASPGVAQAADAAAASSTQSASNTTAAANAARVDRTAFDHLTTGFELIGKHRDLPCESCHVNAIFKGTPKDCAACHGVGSQVHATAKPVNHILTTNRCDGCHTPVSFNPAVNFDHAEVRGTCSSCHFPGGPAQAQGPGHIPTNLECDACHSTIGWAGALGAGMPANHIPTSQGCGLCHTDPTNFAIYAMNHTGITSGCATCHGSGLSFANIAPPELVEPPANHVPFGTAACEGCHLASSTSTGGFKFTNASTMAPAGMVHSATNTGACSTCHAAGMMWAGSPATVVFPATHVAIAGAECSTCHSGNTTFKFANASSAAAPGMVHSAVASLACSSCHEAGKTDIGAPPTVVRPALKASGAAHVPNGECSACHFNTTSFKGASDLPSNHIPLPTGANANCTACHASAADYSQYTMDHSVVAATCTSCHASGLSFANMAPPALKVPPANHVPFGTAECSTCHSPTNFTSFMMTNTSAAAPPAMVHASVPGATCATCHAAGLTWVGAPATLTSSNTSTASPHVPLPAGAACESCHMASSTLPGGFSFANASGAAPPAMVHTQVSSIACDQCHAAGKVFAGAPATKVVPANHVPFPAGTACTTCHSATNFNTFVFTNASTTAAPGMVHTAVASIVCSTCHEKNLSWAGTPVTVLRPALKASGAVHTLTGECSSCHLNTVSFKGASDLPANHIPLLAPTTVNCQDCHSNASDYSVYAMNHADVTAVCSTCHAAGKSFDNMASPVLKQPPANHVPFGTAECATCHSATNFTTFLMTNASGTVPPAMVHASVPGVACATCHAAGQSWVGVPTTKAPPANHVPFPAGTACESCHAAANFTSFMFTNASTTAAPGMVHTAVASIVCSTCHEKNLSWAGVPVTLLRPALKASGAVHTQTGECSTCHLNTVSFKGATDLPTNHIPLLAPTTVNCQDCHSNAGDYSVYTMNHADVTATCSTCHAAGKSFANMASPVLKQPPANHVPFGTAECSTCHSPTNFTTFLMANASGTVPPAMVHSSVPGVACKTCHAAGQSWVGTPTTKAPPTNHIPFGTAACESCHAPANFTTFMFSNASGTAPPAMVHSAVTAIACDQCHGSGKTFIGTPAIKTLPTNHVPFPTGAACTGCHSASNFTSFVFTNASTTAPSGMVHSLVTSIVCSTCHEAGKTWVGTPATKVRPALKADGTAHVAAGECSTCHFNTTSFKGATDLPANHIPLPAADKNNCALCHLTAGNYSIATMNHVNITSNCIQCHGYGLSFANMAPPTLKAPPSGPTGHIPSNKPNGASDIACELCHTPTVFTTFAGTVMKHANVKAMTCMSCHEAGMTWKTNTGVQLWVRPGNGHHKGQDCGGSGCHSTRDKFAPRKAVALTASQKAAASPTLSTGSGGASLLGGAGMNHRRLLGSSCVSCHSAASGIGKLAGHMATSDSCESCHGTGAWSPVLRVDHTQVLGSCVSCHDGRAARGKTTSHIGSGSNCESCHTTVAWTPARFDHAAVVAHTCTTCHDSLHAVGKPLNHVPTSAQCDTCHGTLGWKPALMDHTTLTASCATCHNNNVALGVPVGHLGTQRDCATCHSYPDWAVLHFVHASAAYPGDHRSAPACVACHTTNTDQIAWASPADAGSCGGCHAKDFIAARHPKVSGGANYTAGELHNCSGACHVYSDATLGKVSKSLPGPYHRVGDVAFKH